MSFTFTWSFALIVWIVISHDSTALWVCAEGGGEITALMGGARAPQKRRRNRWFLWPQTLQLLVNFGLNLVFYLDLALSYDPAVVLRRSGSRKWMRKRRGAQARRHHWANRWNLQRKEPAEVSKLLFLACLLPEAGGESNPSEGNGRTLGKRFGKIAGISVRKTLS